MKVHANITKRRQRRVQRDGSVKEYDRYILNFRDPKTGKRMQQFFERQKEAQSEQRRLLVDMEQGTFHAQKKQPTVAEAYEYWLNDRSGAVKDITKSGYSYYRSYIVGPLLAGTPQERAEYTSRGQIREGQRLIPMLGNIKVTELSTADIRAWHRQLCELVGHYTADRACQRLSTMLSLIAEDCNLRPPAMPRRLGRGKRKEKKSILSPQQVGLLLEEAKKDARWGIYYAFPFMAGTRPSEQLALHWEDVDFDRNVIIIRRMLEKNGTISDFTKTDAGTREIPMWSLLREALLEWRVRCPRKNGELKLVFPSHGARQRWPKKKIGGGILLYANFRSRVWKKAFERLVPLGISYVTPHSARHCFISTLQSCGVEVGLVAKLAGHATPSVTLEYYTQAVRDGQGALETLKQAFRAN
jgi:integrase